MHPPRLIEPLPGALPFAALPKNVPTPLASSSRSLPSQEFNDRPVLGEPDIEPIAPTTSIPDPAQVVPPVETFRATVLPPFQAPLTEKFPSPPVAQAPLPTPALATDLNPVSMSIDTTTTSEPSPAPPKWDSPDPVIGKRKDALAPEAEPTPMDEDSPPGKKVRIEPVVGELETAIGQAVALAPVISAPTPAPMSAVMGRSTSSDAKRPSSLSLGLAAHRSPTLPVVTIRTVSTTRPPPPFRRRSTSPLMTRPVKIKSPPIAMPLPTPKSSKPARPKAKPAKVEPEEDEKLLKPEPKPNVDTGPPPGRGYRTRSSHHFGSGHEV